ncbi:MAG: hypothetical protein WBP08_18985 [Saprospiraceae bacterium]
MCPKLPKFITNRSRISAFWWVGYVDQDGGLMEDGVRNLILF